MSAIAQAVQGRLIDRREPAVFYLHPGNESSFIRLGFILRGSEEVILPESVLDDWGHEIATMELYAWVKENGLHFPRAEIFGYDLSGREQQCFVREIDLMAGYACYVFEAADSPLTEGRRLAAILVPGPAGAQPRPISPPSQVSAPLSRAAVKWWMVDETAVEALDLTFLEP